MHPVNYFVLVKNSNPLLSSEVVAAFLGAWFAFLFGLLAYWVTKRRERFVQHKITLQKLSILLNENLHSISGLKEIAKAIKECLLKKLPIDRFFLLKKTQDFELEVKSLDVLEEMIKYSLSLNIFDFLVISINRGLDTLSSLLIAKSNTLDEYILPEKFLFLSKPLEELIENLEEIDKKTKELLARIQVNSAKVGPKNEFIYSLMNKTYEQAVSAEEISAEINKINFRQQQGVKRN